MSTRRARSNRLRLLLVVVSAPALSFVAGCAAFEENDGNFLTTQPDQQLVESMFIGKWDLDGELTNTARGDGGIGAIPSDIITDILGTGWRFRPGGILLTDNAPETKSGTWRIEGASTLIVQESRTDPVETYKARFENGYLHLDREDGLPFVFERSKFFGF